MPPRIRQGLAGMFQIEVVGECGSGTEAMRLLTSQPVGPILLDVQMQNCTRLDVVARIGPDRHYTEHFRSCV